MNIFTHDSTHWTSRLLVFCAVACFAMYAGCVTADVPVWLIGWCVLGTTLQLATWAYWAGKEAHV